MVFSLLGAGGQFAANKWYASAASSQNKTSWLDKKWSPMTKLSDEQYANILEEKILRLDADIAIIDEDLTALKTQKEPQKAAGDAAKQSSLRGDKA